MNSSTKKAPLVYRKHAVLFDLAELHHLNPERYPFLLESVSHGEGQNLGRFSMLLAFPQQTFQLDQSGDPAAFIETFAVDFQQQQQPFILSDYPFKGGYFAYFAYDYAQAVEPVLSLPESDLPLAVIQRTPVAVILDHQQQEMVLMAEAEYEACLDSIAEDLANLSSIPQASFDLSSLREEPEEKFLSGVHKIKDYILAGDVFQANLSRQWDLTLAGQTASQVYQSLRVHNPAPFAALCHFPNDWQVISSSPERLVAYDGDWVDTRPIAGTRERSDDLAADKALIEELISHPKERAEHIMLIDLERNDLGRICQPGSVEVNELMVIESYEHVHHIVSNVRGKLQQGLGPLELLHAVFPGGTITGCPKVRCMEIIAELEQMPRKAYTGSLGYINLDGTLDLNILIRSFVKQGNELSFRAGAGIVADSIAEKELEETRHKAKGLLNALK